VSVLIGSYPADTGAQPLVSEDGKTILAVNGEIYNFVALRASVGPDVKFKTHSDCEVIIPLVCDRPTPSGCPR
jgi:asparagine synthetase B (glutamine-hydrolysing)